MIAIIAEKPSLARNIVAGIGEMKKKNGYYENTEYIVTRSKTRFLCLYLLRCFIEKTIRENKKVKKQNKG